MAGHSSQQLDGATMWGGKLSPYGASYGKLMMWFFLVSDALTFGGLLTAYGFIRHTYQGEWPVGEEVFHHFPFMGEAHMPLIYVAFMTFILIVSSVTMVLAVEAGHRNDRRGVTKWMIWTVIGGFIFLGSQVWEWSHFIHGSHFGKVQLSDNSYATVEGEFGKVNKLVLLDDHKHKVVQIGGDGEGMIFGTIAEAHHDEHGDHGHGDHGHEHAGDHDHGHGDGHGHGEDHSVVEGGHASHMFRDALTAGHVLPNYKSNGEGYDKIAYVLTTTEGEETSTDTVGIMHDEDGVYYAIYKDKNVVEELKIREAGSKYAVGDIIEGDEAQALYEEAAGSGTARRVIFGANLKDNEYGPVQYGQFFFFITGFHGFHVFSGVLINLIILIQVLMGVMERRKHYEMVEKVGLYWHFVDLVWVFVFTFFYLI